MAGERPTSSCLGHDPPAGVNASSTPVQQRQYSISNRSREPEGASQPPREHQVWTLSAFPYLAADSMLHVADPVYNRSCMHLLVIVAAQPPPR